ncbi:hypothetical protein BAUCODRAFT_32721 [Baudoinia panamericana UAMH 10762]|uniref:Uncharacterized protein n=1 Tax=Baudoinia panamericana (strain UAMH 10762) TaxID=717646 RepID=M2MZD7_BAUPA|nr:uncharacterized protein BAUCODRAFT_32721 [Baudoinia panamericana UAMH 10762]EMC96973.1 hypothetical protein BAUCODRAFT_32721 [Baudoinia panamericana UAMH 10762]
MLKMLKLAGAQLEIPNNQGYRPLHVAIRLGLGSMAALLLLAGADAEARDSDGWTPLHLCANGKGEQVQIAAFLLERDANLKARLPPPLSLTPLQLAKKSGNATMVNLYSGKKTDSGLAKWFAKRGVT